MTPSQLWKGSMYVLSAHKVVCSRTLARCWRRWISRQSKAKTVTTLLKTEWSVTTSSKSRMSSQKRVCSCTGSSITSPTNPMSAIASTIEEASPRQSSTKRRNFSCCSSATKQPARNQWNFAYWNLTICNQPSLPKDAQDFHAFQSRFLTRSDTLQLPSKFLASKWQHMIAEEMDLCQLNCEPTFSWPYRCVESQY